MQTGCLKLKGGIVEVERTLSSNNSPRTASIPLASLVAIPPELVAKRGQPACSHVSASPTMVTRMFRGSAETIFDKALSIKP